MSRLITISKKLTHVKERLKFGVLATLFIGTQIVFPLSFTAHVGAAAGNPAADLDQCRNGSLSVPAQCIDSGGSLGWVNGNAGASNSHWREGDSLAYRMLFSNLSIGAHSVTIQWDTTDGGRHSLDYLTSFDRTESTALPCSNVASCANPTTFPIPLDPNVSVTQIPGVFTIYNAVINSVSPYSLSGSYSGNSSTSITINFTTTVANPVLAWGGHIASQVDWGTGNSASAVNGSSYHTRLLNLDGSGGNQDRSLSAAAVFPTPTIDTQASNTNVVVGGTVTDTATLTGPAGTTPLAGTVNFYVCGPNVSANPDCTTGGTQVGSGVSVSPGTTNTGSATSSGYTPLAVGNYCFRAEYTPAATAPYSPQNHTNTTTECFTASIPPSTITIIKDAQPDSSQPFSYTTSGGLSTDQTGFTLADNGSGIGNSRAFTNVGPGTYTVTESATTGWDFKTLSCGNATNTVVSGASVTITITGGQSVVCTYTNAKRGTVTVHKVTNPANDSTGFSVTASTNDGAIAGNATQTVTTTNDVVYDVSQGTYNVSEDLSNTPGWAQTSNTCTNVTVTANNLNPTCTITNIKLAKLKIVKATNPSSSPQSFTFSATGPSVTQANNAFTLDTNGSDSTYPNNYQYTNLTPGTYTVTENEPANWKLTGLTCNDGNYVWPGNTQTLSLTLAAGADVTCTYTNTQLTSISGTKYEANADGSTVTPLQNWTIYLLVNGNQVGQTTTDSNGNYSFTGLLPGSYMLAEQQQSGWTQIFHPSTVNLTAGNSSTDNNFGNFHNAQISGFKFNDNNGNHAWDNGELGLSGWTVTIYDNGGSGALLNHQRAQTTTANDGSYSFTNLPPGSYKLCETPQTGWIQTYPQTGDGCNVVTVALSGYNYSNTNFGNQGRGTLTVVKNVDTNGDGTVDQNDVTTWQWGYTGQATASNLSTGSNNSSAVAAGNYTVSEVQKTNYHVTASSCTGERGSNLSTSQSVTVSPGEDVVCTFTNTRDTGTITINKVIDPSKDGGLFDLTVSGPTNYTAFDQSNGGSTGSQSVMTGIYTVSETAGTSTDLSHYSSTYSCSNNLSGSGTTTPSFTVASGDSVTCTFTNTRLANLTIVKDAQPDSSQSFNFHFGVNQISNVSQLINANSDNPFSLVDDGSGQGNSQQFTDLTPGTSYYVSEDSVDNWDLSDISCPGLQFSKDGSKITFTLDAGANVTCTYTNTERGSITIVKDAQPDSSQAFDFTGDLGQFSLTDTGTPDGLNSKDFTSLTAGTYSVTEPAVKGWSLDNISCDTTDGINVNQREVNIKLQPGENVVCTFTNTRDTATVTVNKVISPANDSGLFDLSIAGETNYTAVDQSNGGTTGAKAVVTGSYSVSETAGTGTNMQDYVSTYSCDNEMEGQGTTTPSFTVEKGDSVTCTFTNYRKATVVVTKYNDLNLNGNYDSTSETSGLSGPEPTLSGWDITLDQNTQTTGADGTTTFTQVEPGFHTVGEVLQSGWTQSNIQCFNNGQEVFGDDLVFVDPGSTINCYIGNFQNPALQIVKSNNRPDPTVVGDTVTYTLVVTVPDDSGAVFDTTVTDLPPDNFTYVPGSWTANSDVRGNLKAEGTTTEPTYGSPGIWNLGNLIPGEKITLTYKAKIGNNVSNGVYPDLAFTAGYSSLAHAGSPDVTGGCANSSCLNSLGDPFVTTQVQIASALTASTFRAGQVLGAETLVNTGTSLFWLEFVLPFLLLGGIFATREYGKHERGNK